MDDFPQDLETQNIFQTIKRGARSECKLRDPCSDGSAARLQRRTEQHADVINLLFNGFG